MALDYTSLSDMQTLVPEVTGVTAPSDLDNLLGDTAGKHTSETVTVYRPYYVAARILERVLNTSRLQEAEGVIFDRPAVTIRAFMRQQAAEDERWLDEHADYTVPAGHEASGLNRAKVVF